MKKLVLNPMAGLVEHGTGERGSAEQVSLADSALAVLVYVHESALEFDFTFISTSEIDRGTRDSLGRASFSRYHAVDNKVQSGWSVSNKSGNLEEPEAYSRLENNSKRMTFNR